MKNKAGLIIGFILGMAGFLLLYKLFILEKISPSDEVAPGMVVIVSVFSGALFAWVGSMIQSYFRKKQ